MSKPLKMTGENLSYWHKYPNGKVHLGMYACDKCQCQYYWYQVWKSYMIGSCHPDFMMPLCALENELFNGVHGDFGGIWRAGWAQYFVLIISDSSLILHYRRRRLCKACLWIPLLLFHTIMTPTLQKTPACCLQQCLLPVHWGGIS